MAQRKSLNLQNKKMKLQHEKISGLYREISSTVITLNREFNYMCQQKQHSLFHGNIYDVTTSTHIDLDIAQEKRIDDCWNVDGNKNIQIRGQACTKFILLKETSPKGYMWSRRRLTKIQTGYSTRSYLARSLDKNWESRSEKRKTRMGTRTAKIRVCQKLEGYLF